MMSKNSDHSQWLVIVNPNAGNGKGKKEWDLISRSLNENGIIFDLKFTSGKGEATHIAAQAIAESIRKIITVGGDGTLNEVLNGVFASGENIASEVMLALIPVGTGNDWGRMFAIPLDHEQAARIISEGKTMLLDVGLITYNDGTGIKKRYFINTAGLGFESAVVKRTNLQKDKGRGGKLIYLYSLLLSLITYKNTRAELIIDGVKTSANIFSVNVGNGIYCGGGMRQTPGALPNDGLLDVTVIKDIGKLEIIRKLKILYDGTILSHPLIDGYKCKNLKVTSDSIIYTEADGESLGHTPAEFSILPSAVNIIYGSGIIQ
ncbi:MAG: diacylglycerol kinase family lipid kinase [Bacteroidetes bacterium]|nr:diacylglycerol kinase family lipid kinase [Bacteroidota bacterium]